MNNQRKTVRTDADAFHLASTVDLKKLVQKHDCSRIVYTVCSLTLLTARHTYGTLRMSYKNRHDSQHKPRPRPAKEL